MTVCTKSPNFKNNIGMPMLDKNLQVTLFHESILPVSKKYFKQILLFIALLFFIF